MCVDVLLQEGVPRGAVRAVGTREWLFPGVFQDVASERVYVNGFVGTVGTVVDLA